MIRDRHGEKFRGYRHVSDSFHFGEFRPRTRRMHMIINFRKPPHEIKRCFHSLVYDISPSPVKMEDFLPLITVFFYSIVVPALPARFRFRLGREVMMALRPCRVGRSPRTLQSSAAWRQIQTVLRDIALSLFDAHV